jgi:hypothetical protein
MVYSISSPSAQVSYPPWVGTHPLTPPKNIRIQAEQFQNCWVLIKKYDGGYMETDTAKAPISSIDKLADALAKAQGEFPVIPKDSEVIVYSKDAPKRELYRYKYADLTAIISTTRPALSKHGISFTQGMVQGGFSTLLLHSSGQQLESGFVPCDLPKTQDYKAVAGAITYIKRISLTAALGVSADEDVDAAAQEATQGNSTTKGPIGKNPQQQAAQAKPKTPPQPPPGPTPAMLKRLYAIGNGMGWKPEAIRIYSLSKVKRTPGKLTKAQYDSLCTMLANAPYDEMQANEIEIMYEQFNEAEKGLIEGDQDA